MKKKKNQDLPEALIPAYEWVEAAGEINELANLAGADAEDYAAKAAQNARQHNELDVYSEDILKVWEWLQDMKRRGGF